MIDRTAYLERIGDHGPLAPTADTLAALHEAPARPSRMSTFSTAARALGFSVTLLAARAVHADGTLGPTFDHLALLVRVEGRWLADSGWGDHFVRPLRVDRSVAQRDGRHVYRLAAEHAERVLARHHDAGGWEPLYRFTLDAYPLAAFDPTCCYYQSAPEAPFTQRLLCTRLTQTGRVTVSGNTVIETDHAGRRERMLADEGACRDALWEHFGLVRADRSLSASGRTSPSAAAITTHTASGGTAP